MVLGPAAVLGDDLQLAAEARVELLVGVDLLLREQTGLDALGELDLLLGVEQRDLADLLEVVLDRVGSGAGGRYLLSGRVLLVLVGQRERRVLLTLRRLGGLLLGSPGGGRIALGRRALGSVGGGLLGRGRTGSLLGGGLLGRGGGLLRRRRGGGRLLRRGSL